MNSRKNAACLCALGLAATRKDGEPRFSQGCATCLRTRPAPCQSRECLRLCTGEPAVRLEPSGDVFANPDPEELLRLATGKGGD